METLEQTAEQLTTAQTLRCIYLPAQLKYIIMWVHQTAPHFHEGNCVKRKVRDGKTCRSAWKTRGPAVAADSLTRALDTGRAHQQTAANHSNAHKSAQCCQCWILQPNWTASHSITLQYSVRYSGAAANTVVLRHLSGDSSVCIFSGQQFKNF
jgi:hypothetical protein